MNDTCNEYDRNTVEARTFPWVSAATPTVVWNGGLLFWSKVKGLLSYNKDFFRVSLGFSLLIEVPQ